MKVIKLHNSVQKYEKLQYSYDDPMSFCISKDIIDWCENNIKNYQLIINDNYSYTDAISFYEEWLEFSDLTEFTLFKLRWYNE